MTPRQMVESGMEMGYKKAIHDITLMIMNMEVIPTNKFEMIEKINEGITQGIVTIEKEREPLFI